MFQGEGKQAAVQRDSTSRGVKHQAALLSTHTTLLLLLLLTDNWLSSPLKLSLPPSSTILSSLPFVSFLSFLSSFHPNSSPSTKLAGGQGGQGDK